MGRVLAGGNSNAGDNGNAGGNGNGTQKLQKPMAPSRNNGATNQYTLQSEKTNYLYDGMNVFKEYGENGDPLAQYYTGADGETIARQMFGLHDRKEYSYEGNIRTRGGLMYYEYDGLGNVMDITDRTGSQVWRTGMMHLVICLPRWRLLIMLLVTQERHMTRRQA
jgi:hypothetical protein